MTGGGGEEEVEHTEEFRVRRKTSAEMATVLRKDATILIRLREKLLFNFALFSFVSQSNHPETLCDQLSMLKEDPANRQFTLNHS